MSLRRAHNQQPKIKTDNMPIKPTAKLKAQKASSSATCSAPSLSQCYLEHAARETQWMAEFSKDCDYHHAYRADIRRDVWLMAALIAQERKAQNADLTRGGDNQKM